MSELPSLANSEYDRDNERKRHIAQSFVKATLGRSEPFETSPDVLDFLVREAGKLQDSLDLQQTLSVARQSVIGDLSKDADLVARELASCGIDHSSGKFESLDKAVLFCDSTMWPSISSLSLAYVQQSKYLSELQNRHASLLQCAAEIERAQEAIASSTRYIPENTLQRLHIENDLHKQAASQLRGRLGQEWDGNANYRLPSLDVAHVVEQQEDLTRLEEELAAREAALHNLSCLPLDVDEVLLGNDRMQRQYERLDQQRRDLFRSYR